MKPPRFDYECPETLEEAVELLATFGEDAKILAGGQSFVPMLNLRLARPETIIDIRKLPLGDLHLDQDNLTVGALVRHRQLEIDPMVKLGCQALAQAAPHIGYRSIRNRGTFGGSVAHADATAEIPLCSLAVGATVTALSGRGQREIDIEDFFLGPFTTALEADEILTKVTLPRMKPDQFQGFAEVARRSGDFALVAAAVSYLAGGDTIRVATVGLGPTAQLVEVSGQVDKSDQESLESISTQAVQRFGELNQSLTAFQERAAKAVIIDALVNAQSGEE